MTQMAQVQADTAVSDSSAVNAAATQMTQMAQECKGEQATGQDEKTAGEQTTARRSNGQQTTDQPLKIGVLLSGSGTNLQAIINAIKKDSLPVEIVHVVSSRPDAYGITRAENAGISVSVLNREIYSDPVAADQLIVDAMQKAGAQYIVMAGYMRKLTHVVLDAFPDRVLNLHPALLPSFKGAHAIQDAWDAGVKVTGVTVHLANEDYDKGPIVAQRAVDVCEDDTVDTLETKIHEVEHRLYPWVLRAFAEGRVSMDDDRKVHIS